MKSFIKIIGPPYLDAIKELEGIAIDMPQVCIMDTVISQQIPLYLARDLGGRVESTSRATAVGGYMRSQGFTISEERCKSIISSSGEQLGEFDFFFEWTKKPTIEHLKDLIQKIDKAFEPLGCHYSITTK